jgi:hypothetical protein
MPIPAGLEREAYCRVCEKVAPRRQLSKNPNAKYRAIHPECWAKLRENMATRDEFQCRRGHRFNPADFPFKFELHSGAMGIGSEYSTIAGQTCPQCAAQITVKFRLCTYCGAGAAADTCAIVQRSWGTEYYHNACLEYAIHPITRSDKVVRGVLPRSVGYGDACFPASARVLTPRGERYIASFVSGDVVLSFDAVDGRLLERVITKTLKHPPRRIWMIDFADHRPALWTTQNHSLLTLRGWVRVDRLKSSDCLVRVWGEPSPIERVFPTGKKEEVYNLFTAGEHNFIVDGLVAHNFTFLRSIRASWHRLCVDNRYTGTEGELIAALY